MRSMSEQERQRFLAGPRVAVSSIPRGGDRPPHTTPVWYAYEPGGNVTFFTGTQGRKSRKADLVRKAKTLSLTVQREEFPYAYVTVEGTVVGEDRPPSVERALAVAGRYMPEEQARGFVEAEIGHPAGEFALFTVRPDRWLTFDFADEDRAGVTAEQELRELVEERVAAVRAKDPRPLAERQDPDLVIFDVLPPLRSRGGDAVAEKTRAWFDSYAGDIGYEVRDLRVSADGDVGFCSFLYHVSGTLVGGGDVDMWVRATLCCRRRDGRWTIVHDHESVPFDPASGRALIGLSP